MNLINKKVCRGISILILLMLYLGLCFEAAALEEMALGDFHDFGCGDYSIMVVEADEEEGTAQFRLYKGVKGINNTIVSSSETFSLNDGGAFQFEAILGPVFRSDDGIVVRLTDYKWYKLMAVGDLQELVRGYSIEIVEANDEEGTARFRLYKEGETIDDTCVFFGKWFSLDDGEDFNFEATLGPVFRSDDRIVVRVTDYYCCGPSVDGDELLYWILISSAVAIVLLIVIVIRDRQKRSIRKR